MRQDPRELNHQNLFDRLREVREDIYLIDITLSKLARSILLPDENHTIKKPKEDKNNRFINGIYNTKRSLQVARHLLREVLESIDTSGCYPDPPTDQPQNLSPLSSGLESIAEAIENIETEARGLCMSTVQHYMEGWTVRYHENAVMSITEAKHELRHCIVLQNEEPDTGKEERVQSSSNSLHNAGGGFQASGRAGRHSD